MARTSHYSYVGGLREDPRALRRWTHRFAWVLSCATVVLLAAGALVTSTGSSLAVPDWPLAYGQLFPPMVGGILYEHGHRLIAATVGLLTVLMAGWLWWAEPRRWVRWLGVALVGLVVFQGLLGGLTVLLLLPKAISIGHAFTAQAYFLLTVMLLQVTAPGWDALVVRGRNGADAHSAVWATVTLAGLFVTLLLGATVRHFGAGLAIPDFPLAYGRLIPPLTAFPILIHFLHRVAAFTVACLIVGTLWSVYRHHREETALTRPARILVALVLLQILLGGGVIWSLKAVALTTVHLVNGALLVAVTGLLTLRAWVIEAAAHERKYSGTAEIPAR